MFGADHPGTDQEERQNDDDVEHPADELEMCRGSIDVEHCFQEGPPPRGGGQPRVDRAIEVGGDVIDGDAPSGEYGRFLMP